jgi:shikimate kinase
MPITDFFARGNAIAFRDIEHEILNNVIQLSQYVFATGGGIVVRESNRELLKKCITVFLNVTPQVIISRLLANPEELKKRPLLSSADPESAFVKLKLLHDERYNLYNQADIKVSLPCMDENGAINGVEQDV